MVRDQGVLVAGIEAEVVSVGGLHRVPDDDRREQ